ncbi:MAG: hypothetical protein Q9191_004168 [Dirinaria sp. TL-2023a]
MAPSTVTPPEVPLAVNGFTKSGVSNTIKEIAPSLASENPASPLQQLDASKLTFTRNPNPKAVPEPGSAEEAGMAVSTDHMITSSWTSSTGWSNPTLIPYGPLSLPPTASALQYATTCFEGLKFYRGHDGCLRLFRPLLNCERMLSSAARICLPNFPPRELQKLIEALVSVEGEKWLPKSRPGSFMYLRPSLIATDPSLAVQKPQQALLYIVATCFPSYDEPVLKAPEPGLKLLASREDTIRAWPGGFGYAKVGANYGPSLVAQAEAKEKGFHQILWLFGPDCEVTEAGASNFFIVWKTRDGRTELVTAPLQDKIILDGITRRSVLELAKERLSGEVEIVERKYGMNELEEAIEEGRVVEAFASGTAYFITPVSLIRFRGKDLCIPMAEGNTGKNARILKEWLFAIKYGPIEHPWAVVVDERSI